MVFATLLPCDTEEVDEEKAELRELVDRYDNLMEDCWRKRLRRDDERELNQLHEFLDLKENEYWRGTSEYLIADLTELMDIPFPLLRYTIGMLPE